MKPKLRKRKAYQDMQMKAFLVAATGQAQRLQMPTGKMSLVAWRHLNGSV